MAKKATTGEAGKRKIAPCTECGGPRRGPTAHKPDCSFYKAPGSAGSKAGRRTAGGYDKASLSRLEVTALVTLRDTLEEVLAGKTPEIDQQIEKLKELKASIKRA